MRALAVRQAIAFLLLGVLLFFLTFYGLGERELWSSHEGRAAQDAQTILDGGDWRLPRLFDGRPELQKPPLYYWLTAGFGWLRGRVDEVSVRLPAALASILTMFALLILCRLSRSSTDSVSSNEQTRMGMLCMLILCTMIHFTWMSRVGRIDMPLAAACSWCITGLLRGQGAAGWMRSCWYLLGYLSLAAGLMLKGPIAIVLVGLVLGPFLLYQAWRDRISLRSILLSTVWGLPLVAVLILPWVLWVNAVTEGQFIQEFFIKHNMQRGFGGDEQLDGHIHSWYFYLLRLWLDTAPWSLLLPAALYTWYALLKRPMLPLLGLWWFSSIVIALSCLQYKRADYLLPAYPGLALFLGWTVTHWLAHWEPLRVKFAWRMGLATVVCLGLGWISYVSWILPRLEPGRSLGSFARTVRVYLPAPGQVILFRVDSHHLNWELGKKTERIWEWENLGWWATRPMPIYVVMPARYAAECAKELPEGKLYPLARTTDEQPEHDLPLVLLVNEQLPATRLANR